MMMKILLINGSPKENECLGLSPYTTEPFVRGDIQRESLRTKGDHGRILKN